MDYNNFLTMKTNKKMTKITNTEDVFFLGQGRLIKVEFIRNGIELIRLMSPEQYDEFKNSIKDEEL